MISHVVWAAVTLLASLSVRRVAWLTALYGSQKYSERAMRLLRRPPLPGVESSATLPGPADQDTVAADPVSVSSPAATSPDVVNGRTSGSERAGAG